jgi:hypothetical protein
MEELRRIRVPAGHSVTTAKLIERLTQPSKIGDLLTDEELMAFCGKDTRPDGNGYRNLASAIKYVRKHDGIVWERVRDAEAIKRLVPDEIISTAEAASSRIRRTATAAAEKVKTVPLDSVAPEERPKFTALLAQHAALASFAKTDTRKKLIARGGGAFDPAKLLESFK